jgi:hypothetical protein
VLYLFETVFLREFPNRSLEPLKLKLDRLTAASAADVVVVAGFAGAIFQLALGVGRASASPVSTKSVSAR